MLLPAGLGNASLAGLPPEAGLYSCLFAGLVFWLFCSLRHMAVTVTSAISLLVGTSLGELAGLSHLRETNPTSLALGAATLLLILGKWLLPNRPVSLLVLVGGIAAVPLLGLAGRGVALLGEVPQGLPMPGLPAVHVSDLNLLLPLAMACFLVGAVETVAIGRMFARTPLSGLVASGIMVVVTLFLASLLRGVLIGVVISVLLLLRRGSRPHTTELGRVRGTDYFADAVRHPENEVLPDVSRSSTTPCGNGGSPSGSPRPAATCGRRCARPASKSTVSAWCRSSRWRPSSRSGDRMPDVRPLIFLVSD